MAGSPYYVSRTHCGVFHFHANTEFSKRMERQLFRLTLQTKNTCAQETLDYPSKISLENQSDIENFPTCQKNRSYYNWKTK